MQERRNSPEEVESKLLDILLKSDDLKARVGPAGAPLRSACGSQDQDMIYALLDEAGGVLVVLSASGGDVVVDSREGAVNAAHATAGLAKSLEGLR